MPSHLTIFRLKPLPGLCLFDISPRLGLTVVDRMMGGPGHGVKVEREFTDIEKTVLSSFLDMVVRDYASGWHKYQHLEYEPVESENSARFLNIVPADEIMLYLEMEARFGDCVAGLRFMLPFRSLEALLGKMMAEITPPESVLRRSTKLPDDPESALHAVPVPVSVHWRGFRTSLAEVNSLEVGDVLLLDPRRCESAQVDLGSIPTFTARVDRRPGRITANITGRVR
jgi:flagellar motor switch protein FliM